jgi:mono/diheme cytochrome c family protein
MRGGEGWRGRVRAGLLAALLAGAGCAPDHGAHRGGEVNAEAIRALAVPAEFQEGASLFDTHCASCHGQAALGSGQGPPLVHIVYEPSHHADAAFHRAVVMGVRAHHWGFGDMPPVPGLEQEEVAEIVRYIRWLQRQAGIH